MATRNPIERATGHSGFGVAIVLGSGLAEAAHVLVGRDHVPYSAIEGMPAPRAGGHPGRLHYGAIGGVATLAFAGRSHLYEGHDAAAVTFAVRAAVGAGCDTVILTNAAGGIDPSLEIGAPCLLADHVNLTGHNPLIGIEPGGWERFVDLHDVYDGALRDVARAVDPTLRETVYAGVIGPSYETPAEVRMLATLGAGVVGMSTVLETIAARHLGARVLGVSLVTNRAAGLSKEPLRHKHVTKAASDAVPRMTDLLGGVVERLARGPG